MPVTSDIEGDVDAVGAADAGIDLVFEPVLRNHALHALHIPGEPVPEIAPAPRKAEPALLPAAPPPRPRRLALPRGPAPAPPRHIPLLFLLVLLLGLRRFFFVFFFLLFLFFALCVFPFYIDRCGFNRKPTRQTPRLMS